MLPTAKQFTAALHAAVSEYGPAKRISELPMQCDAYSGLVINDAALAPLTDAEADSGYTATKPIPAGAAKSALLLQQTPTGCVLSLTAKQDGVDDLHRGILKSMYGRRAKVIRDTGTFPGTDTRQLATKQEPTDD